ncbi:hypothetical protein L916_14343 [Phytophthora nicotianae]|nr:hypothetical protein L916_14343 [Phytophthora nicotianae]
MFKKPVADPAPETNSRSFLAPVFKKAVKGATSYMPLAIPHVERAKLVYSDLRQSMDVNTLDVLMFLSYNSDAWDEGTIQAVKRKMRN